MVLLERALEIVRVEGTPPRHLLRVSPLRMTDPCALRGLSLNTRQKFSAREQYLAAK